MTAPSADRDVPLRVSAVVLALAAGCALLLLWWLGAFDQIELRAAANRRDPAAIVRVLETSRDFQTRASAARLLGDFDDEASCAALRKAISDPDYLVGLSAVGALAKRKRADALVDGLTADHYLVRQMAHARLQELAGRLTAFDPNWEPARRERAAAAWREYLARNPVR